MMTRTGQRISGAIAVSLALILIAGACGSGGDDDDGSADEPVPTATEAPIPTPEGPDSDEVELWAIGVSEGWAQLNADLMSEYFEGFLVAIQTDNTIVPWLEWFRSEADLYEGFADHVEDAPTGSDVQEAIDAFAEAVRGVARDLRGLADELESEPAFQGPQDDNEDLEFITEVYADIVGAAGAACFPFQTAIAEADLPLIDCALSSPPPPPPTPGPGGVQDVLVGFRGELAPATNRFVDFARPFAIEFALDTQIELFRSDSEIRPLGDWPETEYFLFWVVAPNELPVPGTPYGAIGDTVPFPNDLGTWFADSGLDIIAEGTTELAEGTTAPYWTVAEPGWSLESSGPGVIFANFGDSPTPYPIRHNSTVWQIPHPDGPLVVIAPEKWEIPGAPGIDELTEFIEPIVATIVPVDGIDTPAPTPEPTTTPSSDEGDASGDADVADLREALLALGGEVFPPPSDVPDDVVEWQCSEPEFELGPIQLAAPWLEVGLPDASVTLYEFASVEDVEAYFGAVETIEAVCGARFNLTFERVVLTEDSEPGSFLTYQATATAPEETFEFFQHIRRIGELGVVRIGANSLDGVLSLVGGLGLA